MYSPASPSLRRGGEAADDADTSLSLAAAMPHNTPARGSSGDVTASLLSTPAASPRAEDIASMPSFRTPPGFVGGNGGGGGNDNVSSIETDLRARDASASPPPPPTADEATDRSLLALQQSVVGGTSAPLLACTQPFGDATQRATAVHRFLTSNVAPDSVVLAGGAAFAPPLPLAPGGDDAMAAAAATTAVAPVLVAVESAATHQTMAQSSHATRPGLAAAATTTAAPAVQHVNPAVLAHASTSNAAGVTSPATLIAASSSSSSQQQQQRMPRVVRSRSEAELQTYFDGAPHNSTTTTTPAATAAMQQQQQQSPSTYYAQPQRNTTSPTGGSSGQAGVGRRGVSPHVYSASMGVPTRGAVSATRSPRTPLLLSGMGSSSGGGTANASAAAAAAAAMSNFSGSTGANSSTASMRYSAFNNNNSSSSTAMAASASPMSPLAGAVRGASAGSRAPQWLSAVERAKRDEQLDNAAAYTPALPPDASKTTAAQQQARRLAQMQQQSGTLTASHLRALEEMNNAAAAAAAAAAKTTRSGSAGYGASPTAAAATTPAWAAAAAAAAGGRGWPQAGGGAAATPAAMATGGGGGGTAAGAASGATTPGSVAGVGSGSTFYHHHAHTVAGLGAAAVSSTTPTSLAAPHLPLRAQEEALYANAYGGGGGGAHVAASSYSTQQRRRHVRANCVSSVTSPSSVPLFVACESHHAPATTPAAAMTASGGSGGSHSSNGINQAAHRVSATAVGGTHAYAASANATAQQAAAATMYGNGNAMYAPDMRWRGGGGGSAATPRAGATLPTLFATEGTATAAAAAANTNGSSSQHNSSNNGGSGSTARSMVPSWLRHAAHAPLVATETSIMASAIMKSNNNNNNSSSGGNANANSTMAQSNNTTAGVPTIAAGGGISGMPLPYNNGAGGASAANNNNNSSSSKNNNNNNSSSNNNSGGSKRQKSSGANGGGGGGGGGKRGGGGGGNEEKGKVRDVMVTRHSDEDERDERNFRARNVDAVHAIPWDQRRQLPMSGFGTRFFALLRSPRFWEKLDWTVRGAWLTVLPTMILSLDPTTQPHFPMASMLAFNAFWITMPTFGSGMRELFIALKGFGFGLLLLCVVLAIRPGPVWLSLLLVFLLTLGSSFIAQDSKKTCAYVIAATTMQYVSSPSTTSYDYAVQYFISVLIALAFAMVGFVLPFIHWSSDMARHYIGAMGTSLSITVQGTCSSFWTRNPLERELNVVRLRQLRVTAETCMTKASVALSETGYEPHTGTFMARLRTRFDFCKHIHAIMGSMITVIELIAAEPERVETPMCAMFGQRIADDLFVLSSAMDSMILKIVDFHRPISRREIAFFGEARERFQEALARVREEVILTNENYETDESDVFLGFFMFSVDELCQTISDFDPDGQARNCVIYFLLFVWRDLKSMLSAFEVLYYAVVRRRTITRRLKEAIKLALCMTVPMIFQVYALGNDAASPMAGAAIIALVYNPTGSESFHYASNRLQGTVLGSLSALLSVQIANGRLWVLYLFIALISFVGGYVQAAPGYYALGNAIVCSTISIATQYRDQTAAMVRIQQNCFAILLYFVIVSVVWPMRGHTKVKMGLDVSLRCVRESTARLLRNLDMPEEPMEVAADTTALLKEMEKKIAQQIKFIPGAMEEPTMSSATFPEDAWKALVAAQRKLHLTLSMMCYAYRTFMSSSTGLLQLQQQQQQMQMQQDGGEEEMQQQLQQLSVHWVVLHRIAPYARDLADLVYAAVDLYLLSLSKVTVVPTDHLTRLRSGMMQAHASILETYIQTIHRTVAGEDDCDDAEEIVGVSHKPRPRRGGAGGNGGGGGGGPPHRGGSEGEDGDDAFASCSDSSAPAPPRCNNNNNNNNDTQSKAAGGGDRDGMASGAAAALGRTVSGKERDGSRNNNNDNNDNDDDDRQTTGGGAAGKATAAKKKGYMTYNLTDAEKEALRCFITNRVSNNTFRGSFAPTAGMLNNNSVLGGAAAAAAAAAIAGSGAGDNNNSSNNAKNDTRMYALAGVDDDMAAELRKKHRINADKFATAVAGNNAANNNNNSAVAAPLPLSRTDNSRRRATAVNTLNNGSSTLDLDDAAIDALRNSSFVRNTSFLRNNSFLGSLLHRRRPASESGDNADTAIAAAAANQAPSQRTRSNNNSDNNNNNNNDTNNNNDDSNEDATRNKNARQNNNNNNRQHASNDVDHGDDDDDEADPPMAALTTVTSAHPVTPAAPLMATSAPTMSSRARAILSAAAAAERTRTQANDAAAAALTAAAGSSNHRSNNSDAATTAAQAPGNMLDGRTTHADDGDSVAVMVARTRNNDDSDEQEQQQKAAANVTTTTTTAHTTTGSDTNDKKQPTSGDHTTPLYVSLDEDVNVDAAQQQQTTRKQGDDVGKRAYSSNMSGAVAASSSRHMSSNNSQVPLLYSSQHGGGSSSSGGGSSRSDDAPSDFDDALRNLSFFDAERGEFVLTNSDIHSLEAFLFGTRALVVYINELQNALLEMQHQSEVEKTL